MSHNAMQLDSSANRTTDGTGTAVKTPEPAGRVSVAVNVTATTGTPSMTVRLEWSHDGTTFHAADPAQTFTPITAAGAVARSFPVLAPYLRCAWSITGTGGPSFTFTTAAMFTEA